MKRIYYYYVAVASFFGLFALLMAWITVLSPPERIPVALVLLSAVTPLLLPFRGMLNGNLKSCTWMSYVSLLYFTHGVSEAYANHAERTYALTEAILSLILCFATGLYVYTLKK